MLSYRAFRRFIGVIYKGLTEGKENLYEWDKLMGGSFAQNMDGIATSALYLKNAIGTLAEPLISIVTPAFEKFADVAVSGINSVAEGLAIITGSTAWTKATKAAAEYGKVTGKLAGIDELHIIGSGKNTPITEMFQAEKVNKDLKELFDSGRYENFGKAIAAGLNKGVKALDNFFTEMRVKGVKTAKTAARVANGIVDAFAFNSLGKAAGKGVNALFDTANTFLENFDFRKLGGGLMNTINGLFDEIDWQLLGRTFANKWNAMVNFASGAIQAASPFKYGRDLGTMLASWVETIDWTTAGENIGGLTTKLFSNISAFFQTADITQLASGIAEFINRAIHTTNWEQVGKGLESFFGETLAGLATLVDETDWEALGKGVGDMLAEIKWGEHLITFGTKIGEAIFESIKGAFETKSGSIAAVISGTILGALGGGMIGGLPGAAIGAIIGGTTTSAVGVFSNPDQYRATWGDTAKKRIGGRALGGSVPQGDLFYASEKGPEYVGTLGGTSTAVANNQSIIEGVKQGVLAAFQQANGSANGDTPREITITLRTENRVLGETVVDYINGETRRTGNSPLYSY
ncbi:MAG: hypothetical protein IKF39_02420 [Oscillospiraceae bacterium]|nr:hypothetical protein [Oscillospiraceae bacterium]